ncbi:Hypothetical predicted protein [Pelobates cultripes]|uniref:Brinker DNA-binding domain-containing protein n=1 Tax=Pelobates cultripes TaxID=61616 RepID=A0AAD1W0N5_PELCU|nr:Hypothetical predicted protein [Pelobates cultripes]
MATQGIKRKRSAYDASFKLKVVDHAEIHGNRAASREFTVPETNVREWRKQKVVLKDMNKTKKAQRGRQAMYPDMEKELYEWIIDQRSSGEKWITWMKSDDKELTAKGNLKKPGLSLVTSWVKTSWEDIPKEMIIKSFLKTGISNKMDGTEDDLLWNSDSEESEETGETDVAANWDTDEKFTQEEWEQL